MTDLATILQQLQDPMGVPSYPIIFQVLLVLTFVLHIIFVNLALGGLSLALFGYFRSGDYWTMLAKSMAKVATISVSFAILMGVAPLLFVQVIYDHFWYASNMLSATWVIAFLFIMMLGYALTYKFYLGKKSKTEALLALLLFLGAGFIMHALSYQALQPDKWLLWQTTSGGELDTSGLALHSFNSWRFLHVIFSSFVTTGILLMLWRWYFDKRPDLDKNYLNWVNLVGKRIALWSILLVIGTGVGWLLTTPKVLAFHQSITLMIGVVLGIVLAGYLHVASKNPLKHAIPVALLSFVTIFVMSYARELLRMDYLAQYQYVVFDYKVNLDWGSTALFFSTFVWGFITIGYLLAVAFQAGQTSGQYTATQTMDKWGTFSIISLVIWLAVVVALGLFKTLGN